MFESFKQSVTLNTIYHQTGQSAEQVAFREALLRLRTYSTTSEDFELFSGRFWDYLTPEQKIEFDDVLHLLPTQASVLEFNCQRLVASAKPVLRCHAKHNHTEAKSAKSNDADGLEKEVLLAEGAKVMLTVPFQPGVQSLVTINFELNTTYILSRVTGHIEQCTKEIAKIYQKYLLQ